jgi:hypothetical protein
MTIENDILREQLLVLMKSPQLELPDYSGRPDSPAPRREGAF